MLDVGSYRNAINVIEDDGSRVGPPRYRSLTPDPYGQSNYRGSNITSYHSQQNLDGDWLPVQHSGSGNLVYSRNHRSQNLDSDRMSRPSGSREVRFRDYSHQDPDDEGFLPIPNGANSRSVGFSQHSSRNDGRHQGADRTRVNGSGGREYYYPEQVRQSTSRVVYSGGREHRPRERIARSEAAVKTNSFAPSSNWDETGGRSTTRMVFDGKHDAFRPERTSGISTAKRAPEERQFLSDVQKELEFQRHNWKDEIERMTGTTASGAISSSMATKSSFVDTSGIEPCFKAYVDVREFPPSSVTVNVDKLTNKVVIEANQVSGTGSVAKTFTQKVQLPRFADDTRLSARMNRDGILKVEVPLIYYFPEEEANGQKTKSFVYEVRKNPDGSKLIEILVKPGQDLSIDELRVEVNNDDKLIVSAVKSGARGAAQKSIIKTYTLPENADVQGITSNRTRDGCLTILVPIYDGPYK